MKIRNQVPKIHSPMLYQLSHNHHHRDANLWRLKNYENAVNLWEVKLTHLYSSLFNVLKPKCGGVVRWFYSDFQSRCNGFKSQEPSGKDRQSLLKGKLMVGRMVSWTMLTLFSLLLLNSVCSQLFAKVHHRTEVAAPNLKSITEKSFLFQRSKFQVRINFSPPTSEILFSSSFSSKAIIIRLFRWNTFWEVKALFFFQGN